MMKLNWFAAAVLLFPLGCGKAMTPEQKIEMLEGMRLETFADLHRHHAECEAQAIATANIPNQQRFVSACFETYAAMVGQSTKHLEDIGRRIEEIRRVKPFNGNLGEETGR